MEFLKRHYEKIILSVVLIGLAAAVAMLPMKIREEKEYLTQKKSTISDKPIKYVPLDHSSYDKALARATNNTPVVLNGGVSGHNTFNPVLWQVKEDGTLIKIVSPEESIGLKKLELVSIKPLNYVVAFEKVSGFSYVMTVFNEAKPKISKRTCYLSKASPKVTGMFSLVEVKGESQNPEALVIEMADTKEQATITTNQPFKRVEMYVADMRYDLEKREFKQQKKGDKIGFAGDIFKIVDIKADEVVFFAESSGKTVSVKLKAAAQ
ncbi:MAG: hypothetical protein WCO56_06845 [Verrucomicrobiota bacterium]